MSKVLFLDDRQKRVEVAKERYKDDELTIVQTVEDAISALSSESWWDFVCLDHDLNYEEGVDSNRPDCGMEVVRWMVAYLGPLNKIAKNVIVHSSNLYAALEMYSALRTRGYYVLYERFRYE